MRLFGFSCIISIVCRLVMYKVKANHRQYSNVDRVGQKILSSDFQNVNGGNASLNLYQKLFQPNLRKSLIFSTSASLPSAERKSPAHRIWRFFVQSIAAENTGEGVDDDVDRSLDYRFNFHHVGRRSNKRSNGNHSKKLHGLKSGKKPRRKNVLRKIQDYDILVEGNKTIPEWIESHSKSVNKTTDQLGSSKLQSINVVNFTLDVDQTNFTDTVDENYESQEDSESGVHDKLSMQPPPLSSRFFETRMLPDSNELGEYPEIQSRTFEGAQGMENSNGPVYVQEKGVSTLPCSAMSDVETSSKAGVTWTGPGSQKINFSNAHFQIKKNGGLLLSEIKLMHSGIYQCTRNIIKNNKNIDSTASKMVIIFKLPLTHVNVTLSFRVVECSKKQEFTDKAKQIENEICDWKQCHVRFLSSKCYENNRNKRAPDRSSSVNFSLQVGFTTISLSQNVECNLGCINYDIHHQKKKLKERVKSFVRKERTNTDGDFELIDRPTILDVIDCGEGYQITSSVCIPCSPGTKWTSGVCISCPLNYYQERFAQSKCSECPVNVKTSGPKDCQQSAAMAKIPEGQISQEMQSRSANTLISIAIVVVVLSALLGLVSFLIVRRPQQLEEEEDTSMQDIGSGEDEEDKDARSDERGEDEQRSRGSLGNENENNIASSLSQPVIGYRQVSKSKISPPISANHSIEKSKFFMLKQKLGFNKKEKNRESKQIDSGVLNESEIGESDQNEVSAVRSAVSENTQMSKGEKEKADENWRTEDTQKSDITRQSGGTQKSEKSDSRLNVNTGQLGNSKTQDELYSKARPPTNICFNNSYFACEEQSFSSMDSSQLDLWVRKLFSPGVNSSQTLQKKRFSPHKRTGKGFTKRERNCLCSQFSSSKNNKSIDVTHAQVSQHPDKMASRTKFLSTFQVPTFSALHATSLSTLQAPSRSTLQAPSRSTPQAPSRSTLRAPSLSTLQAPSRSTLRAPSLSTLQASSRSTLQAPPSLPTLQAPSRSTPHAPFCSTFQAPSRSTLQAPSRSTIQAPSLSTLQAPTRSTIQAPSRSTIQAPSRSTIQAPSLSTLRIPFHPLPATPEAPSFPAASQAPSHPAPPHVTSLPVALQIPFLPAAIQIPSFSAVSQSHGLSVMCSGCLLTSRVPLIPSTCERHSPGTCTWSCTRQTCRIDTLLTDSVSDSPTYIDGLPTTFQNHSLHHSLHEKSPLIASRHTNSSPLIASPQTNSSLIASRHTNLSPLIASRQTNSSPLIASRHTNSSPLIASLHTNSSPPISSFYAKASPLITSQHTNSSPPIAFRQKSLSPASQLLPVCATSAPTFHSTVSQRYPRSNSNRLSSVQEWIGTNSQSSPPLQTPRPSVFPICRTLSNNDKKLSPPASLSTYNAPAIPLLHATSTVITETIAAPTATNSLPGYNSPPALKGHRNTETARRLHAKAASSSHPEFGSQYSNRHRKLSTNSSVAVASSRSRLRHRSPLMTNTSPFPVSGQSWIRRHPHKSYQFLTKHPKPRRSSDSTLTYCESSPHPYQSAQKLRRYSRVHQPASSPYRFHTNIPQSPPKFYETLLSGYQKSSKNHRKLSKKYLSSSDIHRRIPSGRMPLSSQNIHRKTSRMPHITHRSTVKHRFSPSPSQSSSDSPQSHESTLYLSSPTFDELHRILPTNQHSFPTKDYSNSARNIEDRSFHQLHYPISPSNKFVPSNNYNIITTTHPHSPNNYLSYYEHHPVTTQVPMTVNADILLNPRQSNLDGTVAKPNQTSSNPKAHVGRPDRSPRDHHSNFRNPEVSDAAVAGGCSSLNDARRELRSLRIMHLDEEICTQRRG